jgi:glycosyltransferase involved in cell wall biosynthesis
MRLDLLIPTLRRPDLLNRALRSIARAERPRRLQVGVIVINNDIEPDVPGLSPLVSGMPFPTRIVHEPAPGKSAALNAGIAASDADYLGFIDDDEEIARDWFRVIADALEASPRADFLGGRVLPPPSLALPDWIPPGYPAVLGTADSIGVEVPYGPEFPGMLKGGNAVISRATLARVGPYSTDLGPRLQRRLLSCEDEDMYLRLIDAGAHGRYLPNLIVHHCVHPERLRRNYFRKWAFWQGASKSVIVRRHPMPLPSIAGVPRYVYGEAVRGLLTWLRTTLTGGHPAVRMGAELPLWSLAGRLYGVVVHRLRGAAPGVQRSAIADTAR